MRDLNHGELTIRRARMDAVLELFQQGHSTQAIAMRLRLSEQLVCDLIEEAQRGR